MNLIVYRYGRIALRVPNVSGLYLDQEDGQPWGTLWVVQGETVSDIPDVVSLETEDE